MGRGAALHWGGARQGALRFTFPAPKSACLHRVISGGEAGVDRAALDAALALGYSSNRLPQRAALNVREADATLIVYNRTPDAGARLTQEIALRMGKPVIAVDLDDRGGFEQARAWLSRTAPRVLHVAGAGDSRTVGIYARSFAMLVRLLGPAPREAQK